MSRKIMSFLGTLAVLVPVGAASGQPHQMGTAFSYQGQLEDGGSPANGLYDFEFKLCDDPVAACTLATTTVEDEQVDEGLFAVEIDFGADVFNGQGRWLEMGVRPGASTGAYTPLTPRQKVIPTPHALALPGLWTQQNVTSPNLIGGYADNQVTGGVFGAAIGGGGSVGEVNRVTQNFGTVGGGQDNSANGAWSTVGGGRNNTASMSDCTVGGGFNNSPSGFAATVGGGSSNSPSGTHSTVGGGFSNNPSGGMSTVGGGRYNSASGEYSTVPGGYDNDANGDYSFAAGRRAKVRSATQASEDPETCDQDCGDEGTFVWADSTDADFTSTGPNQFLIRASGGVGIGHDSPSDELDVRTSSKTRAIYAQNTKSTDDNVGIIGTADGDGGNQSGVVGSAFLNTTSPYFAKGVIGYADADDSAGLSALAYGGQFSAYADAYAYGVMAHAHTDTMIAYGVYAGADTDNSSGTETYGIRAVASGDAPTKYAGYFVGDVTVTGTLSKGAGSFKIDHPLDPANKYLYHSFIESPDMMNVYNGNVVLNDAGEATVEMPEWFEALNRDFRYQLTCIGRFAPVYIAEEIHDNTFKIAGGHRGMKVSWQVTGIRQDAFANAHRIPVEEVKPERERGLYLHPKVYGMSRELGVDYEHEHQAELRREAQQVRQAEEREREAELSRVVEEREREVEPGRLPKEREHAQHLLSEPQDVDGGDREGGAR
ncbi:MAG: hypothetical protein JSU86_17190, partial [Phycisphaerales bacterium]